MPEKIDALFSTAEMTAAFSLEAHVRGMLAFEAALALAEARQNSKIWYPRIMFVLSLIMFFPALLILTLNQPSDGTPPIQTNPPLAILGILGGILLFISWFCVIGFAIKREQGGWVAGLIFFNFFAAILYLLLDPIG